LAGPSDLLLLSRLVPFSQGLYSSIESLQTGDRESGTAKFVIRDYFAGQLRNAAPVIESRAFLGKGRLVIRVSRKFRARLTQDWKRNGKAIDVIFSGNTEWARF